jgi:hypothetical protein
MNVFIAGLARIDTLRVVPARSRQAFDHGALP